VWLKDRDPQRPIYVIAAQGGGIYAAYHAALVLAELTGPKYQIVDDIFAISGVSGGSVGTAVAIALKHAIDSDKVQSPPPMSCDLAWSNQNRLKRAIEDVFEKDFVSSLMVGALFVDSIFEMSISKYKNAFSDPELDRARVLERTIVSRSQAALKRVLSHSPSDSLLDVDFSTYLQAAKFHPDLFFNVTSASTGDRVYLSPHALSPLRKNLWRDPGYIESRKLNHALRELNLSLISAAVLSARYPYVTPPASIKARAKDGDKILRFVDGGYFENSGVATAMDIVRLLQKQTDAPIRLVVLDGGNPQSIDTSKFNEILTPFRAMMMTRVARGEDYVDDAESDLVNKHKVITISASRKRDTLNAGWYLSKNTLRYVRQIVNDNLDRERDFSKGPCARSN
jgi:hypothetical protein